MSRRTEASAVGEGSAVVSELRWLMEATDQAAVAQHDLEAEQAVGARVTAVLMLLLTAVLMASAALPDLLGRIITAAQAAS